jgi:O-methyltransferase
MRHFFVTLVKGIFKLFGLGVYKIGAGDIPLRTYVKSDYKKFENDVEFMKAWRLAERRTLVDVLRCHELWSLVGQTKKLQSGCYLEIGVWRGGSGLVLAKALEHFEIDGKLYLADTFTGVVKAGEMDNKYRGGEHSDASEKTVSKLFSENGVTNYEILKGIFPEDTGRHVEAPLRLVHVDVDVYQGAKDIVEWCAGRLVRGGVIVFDDYGFSYCEGVTKLCEEYEMDQGFFFVHNINGHCVLLKT